MHETRIMLLGAGELGKEMAVAAKRLGLRVVAVDRYEDAPAMQVADAAEVVSLNDATALEGAVRTHRPDLIVPELESGLGEKLEKLEEAGFPTMPSARAVRLTAHREATRRLADELQLPGPAHALAESEDELRDACDRVGYPCVAKPVMGSKGRGHSVVSGPAKVERAWEYARVATPGDRVRLVVEEFVAFDLEVVLLGVRQPDGEAFFLTPVAHRHEEGVYRESWTPAGLTPEQRVDAHRMARQLMDHLGGAGLYAVEFFLTASGLVFSEVVPRPHASGMVTMASQDLSQFELHLRGILGLPVPAVRYHGPAASAVVLASEGGAVERYDGVERSLEIPTAQLRVFGKPEAYRGRRMGMALATGADSSEARSRALEAAARVDVRVDGRQG